MDSLFCPLLSITPGELRFPYELEVEVPTSVQLENVTANYVAFRVKTNAASKYFTEPSSGVLPPHGNIRVAVTMHPQHEIPADGDIKDKFLVQSVTVPNDSPDLTGNLKKFGEVHDLRLAVRFIDKETVVSRSEPVADSVNDELASSPEAMREEANVEGMSHKNLGGNVSPSDLQPANKSENVAQRENLTLEMAELRKALEVSEELVRNVKTDLEHMRSANEAVEREKSDIQEQLAISTKKLEEMQKRVQEDALDLKELRLSLADYETNSQQTSSTEQEEIIAGLNRRLEDMKEMLSANEEVVAKKEQEMISMRIEAEQEAQRKANVALFSLRSELASTRTYSEQLLTQLEELEAKRWEERTSLMEKISFLEQSSDMNSGERPSNGPPQEEARHKIESLERELSEAKSTIEELRSQVSESRELATLEDGEDKSETLERELLEAKSSIEKLQYEVSESREHVLLLEKKNKSLVESGASKSFTTSKIKQVEESAAREAQRAEKLRRELAIVNTEIQGARVAIDELKLAAEKFLEEKVALEEVLAQIEVTDVRHNLKHTLKVVPFATNGSYTHGTFTCNTCFKYGNGWVWECSSAENCDYHLHLGCLAINKGPDPRGSG